MHIVSINFISVTFASPKPQSCWASSPARFTRTAAASTPRRRVACSAHADAPQDRLRRLASLSLGAAAAAALALSPLSAEAVSGGGGIATSLAFKDLSSQDLRKRSYTKADLRGADFSKSNLDGVSLFGAICVDAKFVGTSLRGADLESADFLSDVIYEHKGKTSWLNQISLCLLADLEGADLSNAVLEGALLSNAQLQRIKSISGADFTDALIRKDVQQGLCKFAEGTNPITGVDTRESLYCP